MDRELFRGVVPFVAVAEQLSFRKAGVKLGVTPAAISKAVLTLEAELGVQLLQRSSRAVSLTHEGEAFLERCRGAIATVEAGREELRTARRGPQGQAVLSVPSVLAPWVLSALAALRLRHPRLQLQLRITDQVARLAAEGIDVAVRMGSGEDQSLVTRVLRKTRWQTLAAPAYLARRRPPRSVEELLEHDCIGFVGPDGRDRAWVFESGERPLSPCVRLDHGPSLLDAARAGLGIVQVLDFMAASDLQTGRLVAVLPQAQAEGPTLRAMCTPRRRSSANVRALFDALAKTFSVR